MSAAVFQYDRVMRMARDIWADSETRFFGKVVSGALSLSDTVLVPVVGGDSIPTTICRFTEDFTQEWLGLPFYERVTPDSIGDAFCVCLSGAPLAGALISPTGSLVTQPFAGQHFGAG